jgi:hypothetical protein
LTVPAREGGSIGQGRCAEAAVAVREEHGAGSRPRAARGHGEIKRAGGNSRRPIASRRLPAI